jgi:hypothetical protein
MLASVVRRLFDPIAKILQIQPRRAHRNLEQRPRNTVKAASGSVGEERMSMEAMKISPA